MRVFGVRLPRRWVLDAAPRSCERYQIEVAINFALESHGGTSEAMILQGARFRSKVNKFGTIGGAVEYWRMMREVRRGQSALARTGECVI